MAEQLPLTAELGAEVRPAIPKRYDIWFVLAWSAKAQMWRIPPGSWGCFTEEVAERFIKRLGNEWRGARVVRIPGDAATAAEKGV